MKNKKTGIIKERKAGVQYCDLRTIHTQEMLASLAAT